MEIPIKSEPMERKSSTNLEALALTTLSEFSRDDVDKDRRSSLPNRDVLRGSVKEENVPKRKAGSMSEQVDIVGSRSVCANRECDRPSGQPDKPKSIYCSKRCQSREQNLRQGRIKNILKRPAISAVAADLTFQQPKRIALAPALPEKASPRPLCLPFLTGPGGLPLLPDSTGYPAQPPPEYLPAQVKSEYQAQVKSEPSFPPLGKDLFRTMPTPVPTMLPSFTPHAPSPPPFACRQPLPSLAASLRADLQSPDQISIRSQSPRMKMMSGMIPMNLLLNHDTSITPMFPRSRMSLANICDSTGSS